MSCPVPAEQLPRNIAAALLTPKEERPPKESRGERWGIAHGPRGRGISPFTQNREKLFRAWYSNESPPFTNSALFPAGKGTLTLLANLFCLSHQVALGSRVSSIRAVCSDSENTKAAKLLRKYQDKAVRRLTYCV